MLRSSISTSCEVAKVPVDCRLVTWMSRAESWMTLTRPVPDGVGYIVGYRPAMSP